MTVDQWASWHKRLLFFILVPLLLLLVVMGLRVLMPMNPTAEPVVEASSPAVAEVVGTAGSFVTLYRVEYEGRVYLVTTHDQGAVAIIEHEMVAK